MTSESDEFVCPICGDCIHITEMFIHVFTQHPAFLIVWSSINFPSMHTHDSEYEDEYEFFADLCERMGNHTPGVQNMHQVTSVATFDEAFSQGYDECPICLESLVENDLLKINVCDHIFCNACISQWLSKHKNCPMCRVGVATEGTQVEDTQLNVINEF